MKNYVVMIRIFIGCYEKNIRHLVSANDEDGAHEEALRGESHNEDAGYDDDGSWWDGSEFVYRVVSCKEVTPEEFSVLNKYL
ncbi:hypothetical protein [Pseudoalteromonas sp.]|uniref:hypothetical protein n=1 Tax=Pseudoalteromonas sp. TaxID=53249 RepID=UPI00272AA47F|nr:hypothetical protein [Pseudoalteromonas sp.]